jgi:LacI family transcriptional regulator
VHGRAAILVTTRRGPATALEVARLAGVSRTAVSFVLNDNDVGNIAPATRARILQAARELGYTPNGVAQSLRRQRTHVVGLITDSIATSAFAGHLIQGAMDRAAEHGFLLAVYDSDKHPARELAAAQDLLNRRADGILYAAMSLRQVDELPDVGLPMTLANCFEPDDAHLSIIPAEEDAGRAAARYLLERGHRRITMLGGGREPLAGPLRARGFRTEMRSAGVPAADSPVVSTGWTIDRGYVVGMRVLEDRHRPTAIFAANDRVAVGVMLAAARLGLDIPHDLSLVGFDDQEDIAPMVRPALTTLALPHREMGEWAMDRLVELMAGRARKAREGDENGRVGTGAPPPAPPMPRTLLECPVVSRDSVARVA